MSELGAEHVDPAALDRLAKIEIITKAIEDHRLKIVFAPLPESNEVSAIALTEEEVQDLNDRVQARLKVDWRVMNILGIYGVKIPYEADASRAYNLGVSLAHYKKHPLRRSSEVPFDAMYEAIMARVDAPPENLAA